MTTKMNGLAFRPTTIALAVLLAYGSVAVADEAEDVAQLISPNLGQVSVGAGIANGDSRDRSLWGQYNGLRKDDGNLLLDFNYISRDDAAGLWTRAEGRDIGLDTRELRFSQERQGSWKYGLEYTEMARHDIRTINSAMTGQGTATPTLNYLAVPGSGQDIDLKIKRTALGITLGKWFGQNLMFEASYKHEDKEGGRLFGKGFTCTSGAAPGCAGTSATATGWAALLVPEPIDATTHQIAAKLTYSGNKFAVTGGYAGSLYENGLSTLTASVPGTLNNPLDTPLPLSTGLQSILNLPMALPPDNQSHQFYLSGYYALTPSTRVNFKYAYTHAIQEAAFPGVFAAPAGVSNLGGELNTQLVHLGITARPLPRLSLSAKLRYEDKDDQTPIHTYNVEGTDFFTNSRNSSTRLGGNVEATYRLPAEFALVGGIEYDAMKRSLPVATTEVAGLSALRAETKELGYRLELKKTLGETVSGSLAYLGSKRDGSDWMSLSTTTNTTVRNTYCGGVSCYGQILPVSAILGISNSTTNAAGVTSSTAILPSMLTDRKRSKWRLMADWSPTSRLSVQFMAEDGKDENDVPGALRGLQDTDMTFYNIDAMFALSDNLNLTAFAAHGKQSTFVNHSTGYAMEVANRNDTVGLGVRVRPVSKLDVGADLTYGDDLNQYRQAADRTILSSANVTTLGTYGQLPDVKFTQTSLRLFGAYAIDKASTLRVDVIHQVAKLKEWTWSNDGSYFLFGDNTTVTLKPKQTVSFIGARYVYKFR